MEYHGADIDPIQFCIEEIKADEALLEAVRSGEVVIPVGLPLSAFLEAVDQIREDENLPRMILHISSDL